MYGTNCRHGSPGSLTDGDAALVASTDFSDGAAGWTAAAARGASPPAVVARQDRLIVEDSPLDASAVWGYRAPRQPKGPWH